MVEEPLEDLKSENTETWQKLHAHSIVAGQRTQKKINKSVTCHFCPGKFINLVPIGCSSARSKAVHHTKLILYF